MPNVLELADRYHDALERQDMQALGRIVNAYQGIVARLRGEIDALALEIAGMDAPSVGQVMQLARYRRLMREAGEELARYTAWMKTELDTVGRGMVGRGLVESNGLMRAALGGERELVALLRDLPPEAVERLLGFLDPQGPLYKRLELLAPETVDRVSRHITESVALGRNPRALAAEMTRAFGVGLSDSLRMARTVQLYAYREASRANYIANIEIVRGWVWYAKLDSSTCLSCVTMHGSEHPLAERLNDHHNGRCTQIPLTVLDRANPVAQTGRAWFESQSEAAQRAMMGGQKFEAWRAGKFDFAALSTERDDEVYGPMRGEPSLKAIFHSLQASG